MTAPIGRGGGDGEGDGAVAAALLLAVALAGGAGTVGAQAVDLAPTGALRVAVHPANPALAARDPATGEWRGPWIDLAGALAQRLGVPVTVVEYANDAAVVAAAATGAWDVTSASVTPERAALGLGFAVPYLEVDNTLLVGPGSAIRSTADADRPGVRIAAVGGTAPELSLTALLRQAEVVRVATSAGRRWPCSPRGRSTRWRATGRTCSASRPRSPAPGCWPTGTPSRSNRSPSRPAARRPAWRWRRTVTRQALASGLIRASIARSGAVGVQPAAAGAPGGLPRTGGPPRPPAGVAGAGLVAAAVGLLAARRRRSRARFAAARSAR